MDNKQMAEVAVALQAITKEPKWIRTRKCGCPDLGCRFKGTNTTCPKESSKDAIWLWASNPSKASTVIDIDEEIEAILESL